MPLTPVILGSGRSGQAIAKSLATLNLLQPQFGIGSPVWLKRGDSIAGERKRHRNPVLCIANPHGLHADAILEADQAGYEGILCEKPACVDLDQVRRLRGVKTPTAIMHVYRQMWGVQTLKQMLQDGQLGELISIEGRYWQASLAERAIASEGKPLLKSWKDDPRLSGEFDTYLDVGSHWIDAVSFLFGTSPSLITGWRSYLNSNAPHRDSHVHLALEFPGESRAFGSVSKTFHGAPNHFEINLIGSRRSATWEFLKPDEIQIGEGRDRRTLTRKSCEQGSNQPPHHGMGWLEGYIEIASRLFQEIYQGRASNYPRLSDNLDLLQAMLGIDWRKFP